MDPFTIFAVASAVFSGASAISSSKAAKSQRNAQRMEREQQNMRAAMERRSTIRQMRQAQATALQNAENAGVGGSSGAAGGQGSIISQGNANLSFLDDQMTAARIGGAFMDKASKQSAQASMWGSLASLASTGMSLSPTPGWLQPSTPKAEIPKANVPNAGTTVGQYTGGTVGAGYFVTPSGSIIKR